MALEFKVAAKVAAGFSSFKFSTEVVTSLAEALYSL